MTLVSVIVPVYNVEQYLKQCVDSIIEQDYKDIEVILVDDGSTDSSGNICDDYSNRYSFIDVVHKRNGGLGFARNTGIENAKGDFITFVDSDDIVGKKMISNLMEEVNKSHADTVIGGFTRINLENNVLSEEIYSSVEYTDDSVFCDLLPKLLGASPKGKDSIKMSVWNVMFSMEIIRNNKIRFVSEREYISEDIIWYFDYLAFSKNARVISSSEYGYRITPGSLSQKFRPDIITSFTKLYNYLENRIINSSLGDEALFRLQRQFFVNVRYSITNEKKGGLQNLFSRVSKIVTDDTVQKAVSYYPIREISIKQRIFLLLLKYKLSILLMLIV